MERRSVEEQGEPRVAELERLQAPRVASIRTVSLLSVLAFTAIRGAFLVAGQWFHYWYGSLISRMPGPIDASLGLGRAIRSCYSKVSTKNVVIRK